MRATQIIALTALVASGITRAEQAPVTVKPETQKYQASAIKTVPSDEVYLGYQRHAALAQFYRWNQLSENDASTIENALDILDKNVLIKSRLGEVKGHAAYRKGFANQPRSWNNAHNVRNVAVTVNSDGTMTLTADIAYLNQGMLPNGAVRSADLTYRATLRPTETVLPKFTTINIIQNSKRNVTDFVPQYSANRIKSLVHYWVALIDNPHRNAEPFREIFADNFALNFSVGKLNTFEKFKTWYDGPVSSVKISTHIINSLTYDEIAPNTYKVVVDFDWQGILPDGRIMVGRTLDTWTLVDNPRERFARIKTEDSKILVPFQPRP